MSFVEAESEQERRLRAVIIDRDDVVQVTGNRWLRCHVTAGWWIVDMVASRLCRCDSDCDPCFIAPEHWVDFETVWVGGDEVRAELSNGTVLSAHPAV